MSVKQRQTIYWVIFSYTDSNNALSPLECSVVNSEIYDAVMRLSSRTRRRAEKYKAAESDGNDGDGDKNYECCNHDGKIHPGNSTGMRKQCDDEHYDGNVTRMMIILYC